MFPPEQVIRAGELSKQFVLNFGIVHCDLFVIWNLFFGAYPLGLTAILAG